MNTTNNLVHVISIDDGGGVVVSEEKTVLVRELVRHYTPTWQGKADACRNTGTHYSVLQDVSALLNSLGVEHPIASKKIHYSYAGHIVASSAIILYISMKQKTY